MIQIADCPIIRSMERTGRPEWVDEYEGWDEEGELNNEEEE